MHDQGWGSNSASMTGQSGTLPPLHLPATAQANACCWKGPSQTSGEKNPTRFELRNSPGASGLSTMSTAVIATVAVLALGRAYDRPTPLEHQET
jgi:hypothetical protein